MDGMVEVGLERGWGWMLLRRIFGVGGVELVDFLGRQTVLD